MTVEATSDRSVRIPDDEDVLSRLPTARRVLAGLAMIASEVPVFALFDAARSRQTCKRLERSGAVYQSLYEGRAAESLAVIAPYVVRLEPGRLQSDLLLAWAWGLSRCSLVLSTATMEELRKHFRRFVFVEMPDRSTAYFRFQDPRVLRTFLGGLTPNEALDFFGPVQLFGCESKTGDALLGFTQKQGVLRTASLVVRR